jgi:AcrR family transcriptional regulator
MGRRGPKPVKAEAIARAALALFVEVGVEGATTRAIARRAGTTEGSLYRHYAGKAELARRVLSDCLAQFGEGIARALDGVVGPRERLRTFVLAYLECARTLPLEHAFIVQSHNLGYASVSEDILRPRRILVDILEAGAASGEFAVRSPQLLAPFIAGGLGRVVALLQSRPGEFDDQDVAAAILDGVDKLVGARQPDGRAVEPA